MEDVFAALRHIMAPFAQGLDVKQDEPGKYYLDTRHIMSNKKALFFGSVQARKSYVSYHLMPVYEDPSLLKGISPELRKRMQGKSCFNFKSIDKPLLDELARLTKAGYRSYQVKGYLKA